jgi:hypothetical protein
MVRGFIVAAALIAPPVMGADSEREIRVLFSDGTLKKGLLMAVMDDGVDLFLDEGVRFVTWDGLDPAQRFQFRAYRIDRLEAPTVGDLYRLAHDARRWDLLEHGRRQLIRIQEKWPGLDKVVRIWLKEFPSSRGATLLASGIDAFFQGRDLDAYRYFDTITRDAPDTRESDIAREYIRILRSAGFSPPDDGEDRPLSRAMKLRLQDLQENVFFAKNRVATAERLAKGGSDTQMRNALGQAEETLIKASESCNSILAGEIHHKARENFEVLSRIIRRELLSTYIRAAELYLEHKLWSDCVELRKWLERARRG